MLSNILRLLAKLLLGFTVCVVIIWTLLMFVIHLPDSQNKDIFAESRSSFEEVNLAVRQELEDRGRTKMMFGADFDGDSIMFNRETVFTGSEVEGIRSFGVLIFDYVTATEDMTVFTYSNGNEAIVYSPHGNPGTFTERWALPMSRSYKLAKNWYYTQYCDLDD